jgi:hypothetical protein
MTTTRQLEKNTKQSFDMARRDIVALYDHVSRLHNVVLDLHTQIAQLSGAKTFVASKTSNKLHATKCAYAKNIKPKNKLVFDNKNFALDKGFKTCACVA